MTKIYEFGQAPLAKAEGYGTFRETLDGTRASVLSQVQGRDCVLVCGAKLAFAVDSYEFGVFEKTLIGPPDLPLALTSSITIINGHTSLEQARKWMLEIEARYNTLFGETEPTWTWNDVHDCDRDVLVELEEVMRSRNSPPMDLDLVSSFRTPSWRLPYNRNLLAYRVLLKASPGDKFQTVFDCVAEDDAGAVAQAETAYPGCDVMTFRPFDASPQEWAIYSPNESACSDGAGFWSNTDGWVGHEHATCFAQDEKENFHLPLATGQDARWVLFEEVQAEATA